METKTLLIILIALVVATAFIYIWRRRDTGSSTLGAASPAAGDQEGHGVASGAAAAVEDVVGDVLGVEAHVDRVAHPAPTGPADDLTIMKGVGPKVAVLLRELGVTHYDQIAAWNERDVAAIDEKLGAFRGRITRDQWVEQAAYLARGDFAGFEEKFGKL